MKLNAIKLAVASAAMALTGGAFAMGYDSVETNPSGNRTVERHVWQTALEDGECTGLCQLTNSDNTEVQGIISIANATSCQEIGGLCDPLPTQVDIYCGGDLSSTTSCDADYGVGNYSSNAPAQDMLTVFAPFANTLGGQDRYPELGEFGNPGANPTTTFAWKLTTAENGKITDGWYVADTSYQGTTVIGFVNMNDANTTTGHSLTTYYGTITSLDLDCFLDGNTTDCTTGDFSMGPFATFSNFTALGYITAGVADIGSSKAVPVPAFAAAALGVGLVGITVLTGRRRQVK